MLPDASGQWYEQLRQQVLAGREVGRAWGLNLLQKRGVAAWVKASRETPMAISPVVPPRPTVTEGVRLPDTVQRQFANTLAEIILQQKPEYAGSFN